MVYNIRLIAVGVLIAILIGLAWYATTPRPLTEDDQSGLANPASVHCERDLGGTLELVSGEGGQTGYCHLPDGRVCEEWTLFRDNDCTGSAAMTPATSTAPTAASLHTVTLALGETGTADGLVITPKQVLEDSRCPAGVYCIQAGRVRLSATIGNTPVTFVAGTALAYGGKTVTLSDVSPLKTALRVTPGDYRFTFVVGTAQSSAPAADTAAAQAVRARAAADLHVSTSAITIVSATRQDWPDGCLGLPEPGEMCSQVVTAGYEMTITALGETHIYRTTLDGSLVRQAS